MADKFLDGLRVTSSQWMILDCITRALRENFNLNLTQYPCITFKKVSVSYHPVCEVEPHGYQYETSRYVGTGHICCGEGSRIPLMVSFEQMYGEHLSSNHSSAYLYENFHVAIRFPAEKAVKRFLIDDRCLCDETSLHKDLLPPEIREF